MGHVRQGSQQAELRLDHIHLMRRKDKDIRVGARHLLWPWPLPPGALPNAEVLRAV